MDELRDDLNDGEYATPPQLRTDLLKLHQLAVSVINQGSRSQVVDPFELAGDLCVEIHVSGNDGARDQHCALSGDEHWLRLLEHANPGAVIFSEENHRPR